MGRREEDMPVPSTKQTAVESHEWYENKELYNRKINVM
jgi:hypothetical protein